MRSKIITISMYFITLNIILCLVIATFLNLIFTTNLMSIIAIFVTFLISIIFITSIEKIMVFKYVFKRTKADRQFVKSINNYCVLNNLSKTKIYTSNLINNRYVFIKTSRKNSILIISKNIIHNFNHIEQLEQVYDLIKNVSHFRTVLVSVNNLLFYTMVSPFIYLFQILNSKFFEFIIVMLLNLHVKLNSNGIHEPFKLYAGNDFKNDLILGNISIKLSQLESAVLE